MKQFENNFRTIFLCLLLLFTAQGNLLIAQEETSMDSVEISLITCSPHEEVYSLYGHSALRYHNMRTGQDLAFNYGVFNFKAPHFVLRFVFGLTDYELGVLPFDIFCEEYRHWGSQVYEQVLNLTTEEKMMIAQALSVNLRPENRTYRYNFFYDNCSTRPRDIIERNLLGQVVYMEHSDDVPSYRKMIHEMSAHHPWATFGNDMLLGIKADLATTQHQRQFLPHRLKEDFEHATIVSDGKARPLVKEERVIVEQGQQTVEEDFPLTPIQCSLIILTLFMLALTWEIRHKRCLVWVDALFMLLLGLAGCVLFVMLFSQHPATTLNLQLLLFNPIHLLYIYPVLRHKQDTSYWLFALVTVCLFLIGSLVQSYAEGTRILALCLLSRYWIHRRND